MARHRRAGADPLASMPAELAEFDPKEWALPGEHPDYERWASREWDGWVYDRCHRRYTDALMAWFAEHPEASFLIWIRAKRARRRAAGGSIGP
jgi:hypothetical protein